MKVVFIVCVVCLAVLPTGHCTVPPKPKVDDSILKELGRLIADNQVIISSYFGANILFTLLRLM